MTRSLSPNQEQAYFFMADALRDGLLGTYLSNCGPATESADMPALWNPTYTPAVQVLTDSQLMQLDFLASDLTTEEIAEKRNKSISSILHLNRRLRQRYGAAITDQALRLAIEWQEIRVPPLASDNPTIRTLYPQKIVSLGLRSHGLSVEETAYACGIGSRQVNRHLRQTCDFLGSSTTIGAIFTTFQLGLLMREKSNTPHAAPGGQSERPAFPVPLNPAGIIPRIRRLMGVS